MISSKPSWNALVLGAIVCLMILPGISGAFPNPGSLVLTQDSDVEVIFVSSSCGYQNPFSLDSPVPIPLGDASTPPGTTFTLGQFPAGTELVFAIDSDDGTFYTGAGSRNPDGLVHALVTEIDTGIWRISWEDLVDGGDNDFNDIIFRVEATPVQMLVPEFPSPGIPMILAAAIGGCALFAMRRTQK